jgi:nicotinamidase-related amidase
VYIPRTGQINAWDNPPWVKAIEETKRKTLLIAGTLTSVCMAFPTLSALVAGYKMFCVIDASGNWSKMATDLTLARIAQAGAMPIIVPPYRALIESYDKAQNVQKVGHETKLDRLEAGKK